MGGVGEEVPGVERGIARNHARAQRQLRQPVGIMHPRTINFPVLYLVFCQSIDSNPVDVKESSQWDKWYLITVLRIIELMETL